MTVPTIWRDGDTPPYDRTAMRPAWSELPPAVRARVEELGGGRVVGVQIAGGGFTRGFAAALRLGDSSAVFLKAAPTEQLPIVADSYRREALVLPQLPRSVPAPRLRWTDEAQGWVLLGLDAVPGARMPGLPWTTAEATSAVAACEEAADALATPPAGLQLSRLRDDMAAEGATYLSWFGDLAGGRTAPRLLSPWATDHLVDLQRLVDRSLEAIDGETACHGDLRPDNLVVDGTGRTWICDWNWLALAAPWTDLVGLLVSLRGSGLDADAVLRTSTLGADADAEAVDAWLALIAAFMLSQAGDGTPSFASPWLGPHRAYYGTAALSWLEHRRTR